MMRPPAFYLLGLVDLTDRRVAAFPDLREQRCRVILSPACAAMCIVLMQGDVTINVDHLLTAATDALLPAMHASPRSIIIVVAMSSDVMRISVYWGHQPGR
jgi:hypothetical protein